MIFHFLFLGGRYGNILRYVAVVVNTTLTGPTLKYTEGLEASKKWEEYMEEEVSRFLIHYNASFCSLYVRPC